MNQKRKETAVVFRQEQLAEGIYDMWIETGLADQAKPGQFISVYTQDKSTLLPRPISSENTAEAVNKQADMTGQIQEKLEKALQLLRMKSDSLRRKQKSLQRRLQRL